VPTGKPPALTLIAAPARPAGPSHVAESDNDGMLRAANVTARTAVLALVGILTFAARWPAGAPHQAAQAVLQIAAYALLCILMAGWALLGWPAAGRGRYGFLLPYLLGAIAFTSGVAAVTSTGGEFIALGFIAAIAAGSDRSAATGWIVAGLGVLGVEILALPYGAGLGVILGYPALVLGGLVLGRNRRDHRIAAEQSAALLARSEQLREEQAKVATLDERARIAREIHDVLAHSLGALGLQIQAARAVLTDQHDEARAVELLGQAQRIATDGLNETRRAVHALRGETPPLPEGLAELGADHQRRHGARVSFHVTGEPRALSPDARLALARTAQEALVNTAKHAPHQPVEIRLDYTGAGTSLVVSNHLAGRDQASGEPGLANVNGGSGLAGMRERLLLTGGTLSAGRHGSEWVVAAEVPQ
jgi:signal transduction histidine kinase